MVYQYFQKITAIVYWRNVTHWLNTNSKHNFYFDIKYLLPIYHTDLSVTTCLQYCNFTYSARISIYWPMLTFSFNGLTGGLASCAPIPDDATYSSCNRWKTIRWYCASTKISSLFMIRPCHLQTWHISVYLIRCSLVVKCTGRSRFTNFV